MKWSFASTAFGVLGLHMRTKTHKSVPTHLHVRCHHSVRLCLLTCMRGAITWYVFPVSFASVAPSGICIWVFVSSHVLERGTCCQHAWMCIILCESCCVCDTVRFIHEV